MIQAKRLRQARLIAGLTQTQLADVAGVGQTAITQYETGACAPSLATALAIAFATGVALEFLERPPMPPLPEGSLAYRARASAKNMHIETARQYTYLLIEHFSRMALELHIPKIRLPREQDDPLRAARLTRVAFGVKGTRPLPQVVKLVEENGGVVFSLPMALAGIDAFSFWAHCDTERPVMVLTPDTAGDRRRYTTAHELGHLVMHKDTHRPAADLEKEANLFAAEFLLPEQALHAALSQPLTLESAMQLKMHWKVSIQMVVRRARDIGAIPERRYRELFQQIGAKGWRTQEPVTIPVEQPRLYRQMAETLYPEDCARRVAEECSLGESLARSLLGQYAHRSAL